MTTMTDSWYEAVVPGTVLGSLATTKVIEDPIFRDKYAKDGSGAIQAAVVVQKNI